MKNVVTSVGVLICAMSLAVGCGGQSVQVDNTDRPDVGGIEDDAGETPDAVGEEDVGFSWEVPAEVREAHETLREAECQMIFRCCEADEIAAQFGINGDEEECKTSSGLFPVEIELAIIANAVREGRLEFDGAMAQLCAESYLNQDCGAWAERDPINSGLAGCPEVTIPRIEDGERCVYDQECLTGYCEMSNEDDEEEGICRSRAAKGEDCTGGLPCGEGLYCQTFHGTCAEKLRDGSSCLEDRECRSGKCVEAVNGDMTCGTPPPLCLAQ